MRLLSLSVLAVTSLCLVIPAVTSPLDAALVGRWHGTLRYRDYRDSTRYETLPTDLTIATADDRRGLRWDYVYDDGPGKTVRESDRFVLDSAAGTLSWAGVNDSVPQRYRVRSWTRRGGVVTLVVEGDGSDNDRPARIRETLTVSRDSLLILKETQSGNGPFLFRHAYRFGHP